MRNYAVDGFLLRFPLLFFQLGELSESEDALSEANILNNTDSEVWAYLSLVCLKTGRQLEAEQAYKYAMKVGFKLITTQQIL